MSKSSTDQLVRRFRLKRGIHVHQEWVNADPNDEVGHKVIEIRGVKKRLVRREYVAKVPGHDIVETVGTKPVRNGDNVVDHNDLVALFGREKFELISDDAPQTIVIREAPNRKLLEKMTVKNLQEFAAEYDPPIDLGGAVTKDEIIDAIEITLGAEQPA